MSETGLQCPECGQTENFTADSVVLYNTKVRISEEGWDYWTEGADVEFADLAHLTCDRCGHEAHYSDFCAD